MRIMIKGGVWKNTEDEILKAAVMKYGKNQWARVASLLNRKSAKQCKARWYEWLDPSIKKTEWTREEEEKLLHLAKIMPNQWRTIAPIVGRTAGQCMEHYERLLDQAQELQGEGEETEDPRKLRPGEIDPAPETKPARPDPIDMDEDEKEMLSEARARLANTKGKKAKRKARERALEDAKRLATLQKRRELKAAGIESKLNFNKKRKFIDYAKEIPFHKVPPAGFYDVSNERDRTREISKTSMANVLEMDKAERKNREDDEKRLRERDIRKQKRLMKANAAQAIMRVSEATDASSARRRLPLNLPAPQVSDQELEEIVKMGHTDVEEGHEATQGLIGHYQDRPTPTPLRTPRATEDIVLQEARNQAAMRSAPTPLAGEDMPELEGGTGFGGITPRSSKVVTPNTLATPGPRGVQVGSTPLHTPASTRGGLTPGRTPLRDELGLNQEELMEEELRSGASARQAIKKRKLDLARQLQMLPKPDENVEVSISVEDVDDDDLESDAVRVEDAADLDAKRLAARRAAELREEKKKSSVLQKGLPRPLAAVPSEALSKQREQDPEIVTAQALIFEEMERLIAHDNYKYPIQAKGKKPAKRSAKRVDIENIELEEMDEARKLIAQEMRGVTVPSAEEFATAWEELHSQQMFVPSRASVEPFSTLKKAQKLEALDHEFSKIASKVEKDTKRAEKLEQKLIVTTKGYRERAAKLREAVVQHFDGFDEACLDIAAFKRLQEIEEQALPLRIGEAQGQLAAAKATEAELQAKYANLLEERAQLQQLLQAS